MNLNVQLWAGEFIIHLHIFKLQGLEDIGKQEVPNILTVTNSPIGYIIQIGHPRIQIKIEERNLNFFGTTTHKYKLTFEWIVPIHVLC